MMRVFAVVAVMVQLLLRGVAVPHGHAQNGRDESTDHVKRPHVHLAGQSNANGHRHTKHEHPHRHDGHHKHRHTPITPQPADPSPLSSEHDQDAVYVSGETLIAFEDRISAFEPTEAGWILADIESGKIAGLPDLIACRSIGPPGKSPGTKLDLLPHLLRI